MSKHWNPRTGHPGRSYPARGRGRPRRHGITAGEVRLMLLAGLLLGLAIAGLGGRSIDGSVTAPAPVRPADPPAPMRPADPYAESRRSKEMLERQEGRPPAAVVEAGAREFTAAQPSAVQVIDGDTFRYRGEKIRIADIDTPEVDGRCPYETRLAARATERMERLLRAGPFELHPIDRDEDRYGRKLRIVTRDGRSLGDQLVAEGLARTWTGRREPWCA